MFKGSPHPPPPPLPSPPVTAMSSQRRASYDQPMLYWRENLCPLLRMCCFVTVNSDMPGQIFYKMHSICTDSKLIMCFIFVSNIAVLFFRIRNMLVSILETDALTKHIIFSEIKIATVFMTLSPFVCTIPKTKQNIRNWMHFVLIYA